MLSPIVVKTIDFDRKYELCVASGRQCSMTDVW